MKRVQAGAGDRACPPGGDDCHGRVPRRPAGGEGAGTGRALGELDLRRGGDVPRPGAYAGRPV